MSNFSQLISLTSTVMGRWFSRIRLKDKYPLYTAQKHVIAAITKGFETHKGILLAGMMGVGKTALGSAVVHQPHCIAVGSSLQRDDIRPNQVTLMIAPPHLIDKWQRELLSISSQHLCGKAKRHEDVKAFMQQAEKLGVVHAQDWSHQARHDEIGFGA
jgi:hypothetical protein